MNRTTLTLLFAICLLASEANAFAPNVKTSAKTSLHMAVVAPLNRVTGQSQLDPAVIQRYADLPMPANTVLAEYVWVDAEGNTRSKTRTLPSAKVRFTDESLELLLYLHVLRFGTFFSGIVARNVAQVEF